MKHRLISTGILLLITCMAVPLCAVSAHAASYTLDFVYDGDGQLVRVVESATKAMEYYDDAVGNPEEVVPYYFSVGTFKAGTWKLDTNGNRVWESGTDATCSFGQSGDTPVTGDWDGNGYTNIGVFYGGVWYLDVDGDCVWNPGAGYDAQYTFGQSGDIPVVGDWNGDGVTDLGVYRSGTWVLDTNGTYAVDAGDDTFTYTYMTGEKPVAGDWNKDGKSEVGVAHSKSAGGGAHPPTWHLDLNGNHVLDDTGIVFGYQPQHYIAGDWYPDGRADLGYIFAGGDGEPSWLWSLDYNLNGTSDASFSFGQSGDIPVAGRW